MLDYTSDLQGRDILMISDYVDEGYDKEDIEKEKIFLDDVEQALKRYGIKFTFFEFKTLDELDKELQKYDRKKIIIFNWAEEIYGKENSGALITEYLDKNSWIYSGAKTENLKLSLDRKLVNKILRDNGIGVPNEYSLDDKNIIFPVIVKARYEHGSFGITKKSILENKSDLDSYISNVDSNKYIAEQFIHGIEYSISVWGNRNPTVLPIMDIKFDSRKDEKYKIMTYKSKWDKNDPDYKGVYSDIADNLNRSKKKRIEEECIKAFLVLKCNGIVRFEIREDDKDNLYFIDFNPNPNFAIDSAFMKSAREAGLSYGQVVLKLCKFALEK